MSSTDDYLKTLRQSAVRKVVADLVKEKISGKTAGEAVPLKRESCTTKLKSLEALGVNMTRAALHMRVFKAYKARD